MQKQDIIFRSYRELENSLSLQFDAFVDVKRKIRNIQESSRAEPIPSKQKKIIVKL